MEQKGAVVRKDTAKQMDQSMAWATVQNVGSLLPSKDPGSELLGFNKFEKNVEKLKPKEEDKSS